MSKKQNSMKKAAGVLAVVAGAVAIGAVLLHKRKDGTTLCDTLVDSAKEFGDKAMKYSMKLKDRLLHDVHGPNGEAVYADMYNRHFYEDAEGGRIYLDEEHVGI